MEKNLKSLGIKSLAILLSFLLICTMFPLTVFADFFEDVSEETKNADNNANERQGDVFEVKELRESNVKYFRLEDGSYIAAQYNVPVHYLDSNGEWQDIDNTLTESGNEYSIGNSRIKFAKKIVGNENLFTIHDGNKKISLSLDNALMKTQGKIHNTASDNNSESKLQKMMTLDKLSSEIIYENILENTDLQYIVNSGNIKENIIVKKSQDSYSYTFTLKLNNLEARQNEDGSISIFTPDTNENIYHIPAPVVYDANGDYAPSSVSRYSLVASGNNAYSFTVTVDAEWVNVSGRVFPVTVDPSISVSNRSVIDLDISSGSPNSNYSSSGTMYVGNTWRGYWKTTTLPTIPSTAYVTKATISLYNTNSATDNYVGVYNVTTNWDSSLTWNKTIASTSPEGVMSDTLLDYNCIDGESDVDNRYTWNITSLYEEWRSGTTPNYGVGFKIVDGTTASHITYFSSSECAIVSRRPQLIISYQDMKGIESYWSYTSQSAGLAGTSYINNATGAMVLSKPLLSTTDNLIPYTPTIVYHSALAAQEYQYPNAQISYGDNYMPFGFKLNIQETLVKKKYVSSNGTDVSYYVWADADGTEHAFMPIGTSTNEYEDEDGLQLKLTVSDTACTLSDDSKTVKTFTKLPTNPGSDIYEGWYLTSITDKNNNAVIFEFNSNKNPIKVSIKPNGSSTIDFLEIKYNSSCVPYMIWNPSTKEAIVFRYSTTSTGSITTTDTNYLRELVYAHGNDSVTENNWLNFYNSSSNTTNITVDGKASYTYNSSGNMIKAKDALSGYEIRYTYSNGKAVGVQEYAGTVVGQSIRLSYRTGYTEVRNSGTDDIYGNTDDLITRYTFDKNGRATSIYSTDSTKTQIFGATSGEYESDDKIKNNIKTTTAVGGSATNFLLNGGFETIEADGNAAFWTKSSSNISYLFSNNDYGERYKAYFSIGSGRTDSICQYTKLPAGKYTLSMSINTFNCKNVCVYVTAQSLDDSSHVYTEQVPVNEYYSSGTGSFFSTTFDAADMNSSGGEAFKIIIRTVGGSDLSTDEVSVSVDNIMLEENIGNSHYSLVQLGNFEKFSINSSGTYLENEANFWSSNSGGLVRSSSVSPFGYTGYLSASISEEKYLKQTVYQASARDLYLFDNDGSGFDSSSKTYVVSGFAKGSGQVPSSHGAFRLRVDVAYYTGRNSQDVIVPYYFDFQTYSNEWQFVCGNVETVEGLLVHSITIYCEYSYQPAGYAMFDNIAFIRSTDESIVKYEYYGQTIEGDQRPANTALDGLVRAKKSGNYTEIYEYNNDRQITRIANNRGEIHDYTYTSNGVDVSSEIYYKFTSGIYPYLAADPDSKITKTPQTQTNYSYNTYGQVTMTDTYEVVYNSSGALVFKSGTKHIYTSNTYRTNSGSKIFGALLREIDSLNRKTRYYYDSNNGRLLASVNENEGNGTCYSYDAVGNIVSVLPAQYVSSSSYSEVSNAESVEYGYNDRNMLESITTESTTYNFVYDVFGNTDSISVGSRELASYEYNSYNGKLHAIHYGNGFSVRYVYNKLDDITEVWYNNNGSETKAYEYTYTAYGQLYRYDNLLTGKSIIYKYDTAGKLTNFIEYDTVEMVNKFSSTVYYNDEGKVDALFYSIDYSFGTGIIDHDVFYYHTYLSDGSLESYFVDTGVTNGEIDYNYDTYKRVTSKVYDFYVNNSSSSKRFTNTVSYTFSNYSVNTSAQVASHTSQVNSNTAVTGTYTYDKNGNITKIVLSSGSEFRYVYDDLGQLVREDNTIKNRTYVYTYDNAGNILTKKTYALTSEGSDPTTLYSTNTYGYNDAEWGDLLTSFNGHDLTYDAIGNPLNYYNGNSYTFTWKNGRQLATAVKGSSTLSFEYNDEGIRTSKTVNGVEHTYYLSGSQIEVETWGSNLCVYLYDADGSPIGMQYRTTSMAEGVFYTFWFEKNLQGDIVAVYNDSGVKVCTYTYDAWGNFTLSWNNSSGTNYYARFNPFTYRGYYYDTELGMYYLQSRYYDPAIGRFINPDAALGRMDSVQGHNVFVYGFNCPIMFTDHTGNWPSLSTICAVVAVAACVVAVGALCVATAGLASVAVAGAGTALAATATTTTALGVASTAIKVAVVATAATVTAKMAEDTAEQVKQQITSTQSVSHTVYALVDSEGTVQYIGRTTDPTKREATHKANQYRKDLTFTILASGLDYDTARGMEQSLMLYYHTLNTANKMNNQINGVSPANPNGSKYMAAAEGFMKYAENQISNEILYWIGR